MPLVAETLSGPTLVVTSAGMPNVLVAPEPRTVNPDGVENAYEATPDSSSVATAATVKLLPLFGR